MQEDGVATVTSRPWAAIMTAVGGALLFIGVLLSWVKVGFSPAAEVLRRFSTNSVSLTGVALGGGKVVLVAGVLVVLTGAVMMATRSPAWRRGMAVVAILASVVGGGIALAHVRGSAGHFEPRAVREIQQFRTSGTARDISAGSIEKALRTHGITVTRSFEPGIYLALLGGVLGLVGGAVGAIGEPSPRSVPGGSSAGPAAPEGDPRRRAGSVPENIPRVA